MLIERELFSTGIRVKTCGCDDGCWNHLSDSEMFWGFFYLSCDSCCHPHTSLATSSLLFLQGLISVILWQCKGHTQRSENNNKGWSLPAVKKTISLFMLRQSAGLRNCTGYISKHWTLTALIFLLHIRGT